MWWGSNLPGGGAFFAEESAMPGMRPTMLPVEFDAKQLKPNVLLASLAANSKTSPARPVELAKLQRLTCKETPPSLVLHTCLSVIRSSSWSLWSHLTSSPMWCFCCSQSARRRPRKGTKKTASSSGTLEKTVFRHLAAYKASHILPVYLYITNATLFGTGILLTLSLPPKY